MTNPASANSTVNPPRRAMSLAGRILAVLLVLGGLTWTLQADLKSTSYARLEIDSRAKRIGDVMEPIDAIDREVVAAPGRAGNTLLRFDGANWNAAATLRVSQYYFRLNYVAYPRRVYVLDDAQPFDADVIMSGAFHPGTAWLVTHDIRTVLHLVRQPDGQIAWFGERAH